MRMEVSNPAAAFGEADRRYRAANFTRGGE